MIFGALLGDFWGPVVFWAFIIGGIIYQIAKAVNAHQERQKEENLKYTNPEMYAQLKQMEHERQMMAHGEKVMRHQNMQTGAGMLAEIFRIFKK